MGSHFPSISPDASVFVMAKYRMNAMCVILFRYQRDVRKCDSEGGEDTDSHDEIERVFIGHGTSPESDEPVVLKRSRIGGSTALTID
jgi:hypothetical protein